MNVYRFLALASGIVATLIVGMPTIFAEEASTSATSDAALHTPQHCDLSLSISDVMKIKAPKAKKSYKISFSLISLAGYFFQAAAYGASKAAEEAGVELHINASQGFSTQAQQVSNVKNELSRGIDGLLINPVDVNGAVGVIEDTVTRGVPVVSVATLVNTAKADRLVQDDYTQGQAAAEFIAAKLPEGGEGIVMGGPANATYALRRVAGFEDAIKRFPKIKISAITHQDVDPVQGLARFNNAAQAHPKVDWIYVTYNLQLPPNSVPTKYSKALYVAGGVEPLMVDALKDGTAAAAMPGYPITEGYVGLSNLVRKLNGETLPSITCLPNGIVTKDELSSPEVTSQTLFPTGWKASGQ
jgi:ribose transport system substrate-binding protein